jgi:hypothetical protein
MSSLLQAAARKLAGKDQKESGNDKDLELAMEEFQKAETSADKAKAMKAFLDLAKDD